MASASNLESELERLTNFELYRIELSPLGDEIQLDFWYGGAVESKTALRLEGLLHLVFSRTPDAEGPAFYIGEVRAKKLIDGGKEAFCQLRYCFFEQNNDVASYPSIELYHVHVEGEICP